MIRPSRTCRFFALNLHAESRGEQSKIGLSEESILLDMETVPWYGAELWRMVQVGDDRQLLKIEYPDAKREFEEAHRAVGFRRVSYVMYQARHGALRRTGGITAGHKQR